MCESPQKPLFQVVCVFPNWGDVDCGGCHKVSVGLPPVPASPRHNPSTCSPNSGENSLRKLFWSRSLFGIPSNWPFEEWVETHTFRLSLDPWPCSHCWGQMARSLTTYKKYFILNQYLLYTEKSLSGKDIFSSISWIFPQPRVPFNQSTCYIQCCLHLECHSFVHCLLFVLFSFCFCSQDKREYWRPLSKLNYESFRTT